MHHARRGIFHPAQALAGKITERPRQQRHHHMPFAQQPPALVGRIIAPVGELRAYHQHPPHLAGRRRQAHCATAETVAHDIHRLAGERLRGVRQHGFEIQLAPIAP
ncbi:hypothetical protein D3C76_1217830 [compost metagenome]